MTEKKSTDERSPRGFIPEETWEHAKAARKAWWDSVGALFPPDFVAQRRKARKEALLAARSLLDAAIERIEKHEKGV
jgi:hypothetical protein